MADDNPEFGRQSGGNLPPDVVAWLDEEKARVQAAIAGDGAYYDVTIRTSVAGKNLTSTEYYAEGSTPEISPDAAEPVDRIVNYRRLPTEELQSVLDGLR